MMVILGLCGLAWADAASPDRPTASMGAQSLQSTVGQVELGVLGLEPLKDPLLSVNGLIRYGIGDGFEIRFESTIDQNGENLLLSPGVKWMAPPLKEGLDLGLALHPNLPIGQDFSLRAFALTNISLDDFSICINAGGLVDMSEATVFEPQGSVVFGYQIGSLAPFVEAVGSYRDSFYPSLGFGTLWVSESMAFDIAGSLAPPVGKQSEMDYTVTVGWTSRFMGK